MTRLVCLVRAAAALALALAFAPPAAAQSFTWTKAAGTTNWNTNNNWNPNTGFPNSATADVTFTDTGAGTVNIASSVLAHSLAFNTTGSTGYTLTSSASQTLSGVTAITVESFGSGSITHTINLANVATGSLLAASGSPLTITNNYEFGFNPSLLVIGPNTVIGAPGGGGVTVTGSGLTTISGSFASGANAVTGGLTMAGTNPLTGDAGTLTLSGDGRNLQGPVTLSAGTLALNYTANTNNKLGSGALTLSSGILTLQGHATTAVTQTVTGGTGVKDGHTIISLTTAGASLTLALNGISRSTPGTLNVTTATNTFVTTTAGVTNGILGGWATTGGGSFGSATSWATVSGGNIVPLAAFGTNVYSSGTNTDVTTGSGIPSGFTTNSLRFNTFFATATLSGTNTIQSGGILVTGNAGGLTITGGALSAGTGELFVHAHGPVTINSALTASGGLTKTGYQILTLGNSNGWTGPVNVNQGDLEFTNSFALTPLTAINLNDRTFIQRLRFSLPDGSNPTANTAIRLGSALNILENQSQNSRITLGGVLSSPPGLTNLVVFASDPTSGFNLTNTSNIFTNNVEVDDGFLGITSDACLGNAANTLTLATGPSLGALEFLNNNTTLTRRVVMGAISNLSGGRVLVNGTNTDTIAGTISGDTPLFKDGTGTLVLTGSNTNTGGVQVSAGTLRVSSAANLGTAGSVTVLDGATLAAAGTFTLPSTRNLVLGPASGSGTATIDVAAGQTLTVAGQVTNNGTGSGALLKTGSGTLALTNTGNSYSGGTTVQQGTLQAAADGSLGPAGTPVTVNAFGTLTYTGTTTTARPFTLNGGTLSVAAGQTVTFNNTSVAGGFLTGPGSFATQAGSSTTFAGNTTVTSASLTLNGTDSLTNFANGGQLTAAAGQTATLTRFSNTSSGRITVNGTANVSDFVSNGVVAVNPGTTVNNSGSDLVLGGGSVTAVGLFNSGTGQVTPGGTVNLGTTNLTVRGGLLRNNGTLTGTGTLTIDFGGLVKGGGDYGLLRVQKLNGGQLVAGHSPGLARFAFTTLDNGGPTGGDFSNATGIAGPPLGSTGAQLSGWSAFEYGDAGNAGGSAEVRATPAHKAVWFFRTVQDSGDYSTAGQPANFDPAQGYVWPIVRPRSNADVNNPTNVTPINTVAQIDIFDTGTNATVPLTVATLNAYLQFDASQFNFGATPAAQQGTFAFALQPDALGNANRVIAITYTPVPEPAALVAWGLAGLAGLYGLRPRRTAKP